ncbi:Protein of uncharacterised function (DUF3486) [Actinobacillus equuli]|nr:Protein of uncharacterised function (DUF3486) [Actinobacillus equuli]
MAPRSSIDKLPEDVRHWLERALTENGFSGYVELEELLKEKAIKLVNLLSIAMDRKLNAVSEQSKIVLKLLELSQKVLKIRKINAVKHSWVYCSHPF